MWSQHDASKDFGFLTISKLAPEAGAQVGRPCHNGIEMLHGSGGRANGVPFGALPDAVPLLYALHSCCVPADSKNCAIQFLYLCRS